MFQMIVHQLQFMLVLLMELFQELVRCGNDIYTWCYDADGQLLRSNCPDEALLGSAFSFLGCRDRALQLAKEVDVPVYLGTAFGLIWGAAFEKENGELENHSTEMFKKYYQQENASFNLLYTNH